MRKTLLLFTVLIITCVVGKAQERPSWTVKMPKATNDTYIYICENAVASQERDARNQAIARVFQNTAMRLGVPFDSQKVFDAVQQGTDLQTISQKFNIPIYKVCEYTERVGNNYKVYVLCQVAKQGNITPQFDYSFRGCYDVRRYNNWVALAESAAVPGLGQIGKRHYGEGVATFVGETALVGGAAATYFMGQSKLDAIAEGMTTYSDYSATRKQYENLTTANHLLIGAAAALWVFNMYRAYTVTPKYNESMAFVPAIIATPYEVVPTIGFALNF